MLDLRQAWHPCARAPSPSATVVNIADPPCTCPIAGRRAGLRAGQTVRAYAKTRCPSDHCTPAVMATWHPKWHCTQMLQGILLSVPGLLGTRGLRGTKAVWEQKKGLEPSTFAMHARVRTWVEMCNRRRCPCDGGRPGGRRTAGRHALSRVSGCMCCPHVTSLHLSGSRQEGREGGPPSRPQVGNDLGLGSQAAPARSLLLTGPNMGGKSTCALSDRPHTTFTRTLAHMRMRMNITAACSALQMPLAIAQSSILNRLEHRGAASSEAAREVGAWGGGCRLLRASCIAVIMAQVRFQG